MSEKTWIDIVDDAMRGLKKANRGGKFTDKDLKLYYDLARLRQHLWAEQEAK